MTGVAIAGIGLALAATFVACASTAGNVTGTGPSFVAAYLKVANSGSVPAILTVDLSPPVQAHVPVATVCRSLPLLVPKNDTVKVVIADSTSSTTTTFEVPFYEAGVWAVDCAADHGNPVALGNIGTVSTTC